MGFGQNPRAPPPPRPNKIIDQIRPKGTGAHTKIYFPDYLMSVEGEIKHSIVIKVSRAVLESLAGHTSITNTPQDTDLTLIKHNNIVRHWEYERTMPLKV